MIEIQKEIKKQLLEIALKNNVKEDQFTLEKTQEESFGDYSTNLALVLAKKIKRIPREVACDIVMELSTRNDNYDISIAGPGFINFKLGDRKLLEKAGEIWKMGAKYGENKGGEKTKINLEFVSANPTGPLHIGNARGGPLGDVLANVLQKCGYAVTREYYHNDLGEQVRKLGESVLYHIKTARGEDAQFPEGGYEGEYVKELAKTLVLKQVTRHSGKGERKRACIQPACAGRNLQENTDSGLRQNDNPDTDSEQGKLCSAKNRMTATYLGSMAVAHFLNDTLEVCQKMGINFDTVSKESSFNTAEVINLLKKANVTKEKDGALWFGSNDSFLGDRECVLVKSDGNFTYFANDIAYHINKITSGQNDPKCYTKAIDVWGANHSGHIPRMHAALNCLGLGGFLDVILYQWVSLIRDGKEIGMSKRKGNFVTAREVLEEVGKDAFRWFFLDKDANSHIKFDINLAKERSNKNPVFYVQYAHARMCSLLLKRACIQNLHENTDSGHPTTLAVGVARMTTIERSLLRELIYFPDIVEDISHTYKVQELTGYAMRLADRFHKFYELCPIIGDPREKERMLMLKATKVVLENTLSLLGVSAPESM